MTHSPGDLAVLHSRVGAELLASAIPARFAYTTPDGPRVVPLWFHWTGTDVVFGVFPGSPKLRHVSTGTRVAVSIDSESFPHYGLQIRGSVTVTPTDGILPEYAAAAARMLGAARAAEFINGIAPPPAQVRVALHPEWARAMDMRG
ncbi:MAG: pyridoxamine 5'-phosphate oxidase family protein [Sporichthyaceae bacterium]